MNADGKCGERALLSFLQYDVLRMVWRQRALDWLVQMFPVGIGRVSFHSASWAMAEAQSQATGIHWPIALFSLVLSFYAFCICLVLVFETDADPPVRDVFHPNLNAIRLSVLALCKGARQYGLSARFLCSSLPRPPCLFIFLSLGLGRTDSLSSLVLTLSLRKLKYNVPISLTLAPNVPHALIVH
ncbi:hypothetical protein ACRALDRAFT_207479 [Sodiomyces alcalophilus JCM 7366]|uniref:uncharacterized protein n=1 Tax=Sodiomyces alcalophilus JCM 7366 TaxID=591952 RepID=UPI0039B5A08E